MYRKYLTLFFLVVLSGLAGRAQVIYTDVDPDSTVSADTLEVIKSYFVDMDHNGNYEYELRHFNPGAGNEAVELQGNFSGTQEVVLLPDGHARVLQAGDTIGPSQLWGNDGNGILNDPWYGGGDKYFGFRFQVSGQWHYGWARVSIPPDGLSFTIKDFAYQAAANSPLLAGAHFSLDVRLPEASPALLYVTQHKLVVTTVTGEGQVSLYNLAGQQLKAWHLTGPMGALDMEDLAAGIYVVRVETSAGVVVEKIMR